MSVQGLLSKTFGHMRGTFYKSYGGIEYPFPRQSLIDGISDDEAIKKRKHGEYFPDHWRQFFRPGDTVLDIGAYIGAVSVPLALLGGLVHSFEPSPRNFPRLQAVCRPLRQIRIHQVALSNHSSEEHVRFNDCIGMEHPEQDVRYVMFDQYAQEIDIPDPAFVKMDIEGMETIALHGMTHLIETVRPIWQIEYHGSKALSYPGYPGFVDTAHGGYDFTRFRNLDYVIIARNSLQEVSEMTGHENFYLIPSEKRDSIKLT